MSFTTKKRWCVLKLRLMAGRANMWSAFMFCCEHWPTFNRQKGNGENTNKNQGLQWKNNMKCVTTQKGEKIIFNICQV